MRILIIDDQQDARRIARDTLESMGHEADESTNCHDALSMVAEDQDISMVLLDLGLSSHEQKSPASLFFLQHFKAANSLLKVVVTSHMGLEEAAKAIVEFDVFDCLLKPLTRHAMANAVYRASVFMQGERELRSAAKVPMHLVVDASHESGIKLLRETATEHLLRNVLNSTRHNVSAAARQLNMSREHLYYYLKKHRIQRPDE